MYVLNMIILSAENDSQVRQQYGSGRETAFCATRPLPFDEINFLRFNANPFALVGGR